MPMPDAPAAELHVCVDEDLSSSLDACLGIAPGQGHSTSAPLASIPSPFLAAPPAAAGLQSSPLTPSRTATGASSTSITAAAHRTLNPAGNTIVIFAETRTVSAPVEPRTPFPFSEVADRWASVVDVVLLLDTSDAARFLVSPHPRGRGGGGGKQPNQPVSPSSPQPAEAEVGPVKEPLLAAYLHAVCEAVVASNLSILTPSSSPAIITTTAPSPSVRQNSERPLRSHLRLHVMLVPSASSASTGTKKTLSERHAAALLGTIAALCSTWTTFSNQATSVNRGTGCNTESEEETTPLHDFTTIGHGTDAVASSSFASRVRVSLGGCRAASSVAQAAQVVVAVANKRIKSMQDGLREWHKRQKGNTLACARDAVERSLSQPPVLGEEDMNDAEKLESRQDDRCEDSALSAEPRAEDGFDLDAFGLDASTSETQVLWHGDEEASCLGPPPAASPLTPEHSAEQGQHNRPPARPVPASSVSLAWLASVRPDAARKCEPYDFAKLYAHMLAEISSFSDEKVLAAVAAFPTMHSLLSHLHSEVQRRPSREAPRDSRASPTSATEQAADPLKATPLPLSTLSAVYSTGYGQCRQWNVLNEAIVWALMGDYRFTDPHS